jgi:nucleoside phosphorylase
VTLRTIAVVMAMPQEAEPVIAALGAAAIPVPANRPHQWWEAAVGPSRVVIAVNGIDGRSGLPAIGPEPAVLNTAAVIDHLRPDLVVSAGTAGGWACRGGVIGKVYLAHPHVVRHDRRIDLPGFDRFGLGSFAAVPTAAVAAAIGAEPGVVTTGGSLDESPDDRRIIEAAGAVAKDMEAAAVAHTCEVLGVPFTAIKVLTDLHDVPATNAEQFTANLATASASLAEHLVAMLRFVAGRHLHELAG